MLRRKKIDKTLEKKTFSLSFRYLLLEWCSLFWLNNVKINNSQQTVVATTNVFAEHWRCAWRANARNRIHGISSKQSKAKCTTFSRGGFDFFSQQQFHECFWTRRRWWIIKCHFDNFLLPSTIQYSLNYWENSWCFLFFEPASQNSIKNLFCITWNKCK